MRACNWDIFIECVREVSRFNKDTNLFGIPSLALNCGYRMKVCAEEAYFQALKTENRAEMEKYESFLRMYNLKWKSCISARALRSLNNIKYNKPKYLPLVEDVVLLNKFIREKLETILQAQETDQHLKEQYPEFAKVCLAQLILFNRKRSGEAQRLTVEQYQQAKIGGKIDPVVKSILTEFEKKNYVKLIFELKYVAKREEKFQFFLQMTCSMLLKCCLK